LIGNRRFWRELASSAKFSRSIGDVTREPFLQERVENARRLLCWCGGEKVSVMMMMMMMMYEMADAPVW